MHKLSLDDVKNFVLSKSAFRIRTVLQPMSGSVVFPPTYAQPSKGDKSDGPFVVIRKEHRDGQQVQTVVLDSRQSQANRFEEALYQADKALPDLYVDCDSEHYSVYTLAHRIYDAVIRESELDGIPFWKTELGKSIKGSHLKNADALYQYAPQVLLFGGWDSHSGGGVNTAKIPRVVTSEIVGIDAQQNPHASTKTDPLDTRKDAGASSEEGFGTVPNVTKSRTVSIQYAEQLMCVSLTSIRRILLNQSQAATEAAHTVLACLALYAFGQYLEQGYDLRSGCQLVPESEPVLEVVGRTLDDITEFTLDLSSIEELLDEAIKQAETIGLCWNKEAIHLKANIKLQDIITKSRELNRQKGPAEE
ncbi:type I-U CRISPR-associated RAMP protein Csb1/Cas7u [Oceanimonas smirnovii]|uniref:type I-G CRISPR-associated RAMP protein Csb1/Cas7g n=1 Tax=Oceanimonas smirnovii TaxID=264574 RepID=UPI003AAA7BC8